LQIFEIGVDLEVALDVPSRADRRGNCLRSNGVRVSGSHPRQSRLGAAHDQETGVRSTRGRPAQRAGRIWASRKGNAGWTRHLASSPCFRASKALANAAAPDYHGGRWPVRVQRRLAADARESMASYEQLGEARFISAT